MIMDGRRAWVCLQEPQRYRCTVTVWVSGSPFFTSTRYRLYDAKGLMDARAWQTGQLPSVRFRAWSS